LQEFLRVMALLAAIEMRRGSKLRNVLIIVAIRAVLKFHFVDRRLARRNMALRALQAGMFAFQRISGLRMLLHSES